ncbi:MAG: redoxin domain-containing protein, partial [Terriglobia bacterium]
MKTTAIGFLLLVLATGAVALTGQQPALFQGQLQQVDFKAPEFPPPAQVLAPPTTESTAAALPPVSQPGAQPPSQPTGPEPAPPGQQTEVQSNGITWINSRPLTMEKLRGQVVMLDFWEYTCINCIRTLPETIKWYNRYRQYGFEVIGVHGPEFNIAFPVENVRKAVKRFGIPYPVVVDDQFKIFRLYNADAWPVRFLIDANGVVRYERVGEGGDSAFEQAIQDLLKQAHPGLTFPTSDAIAPPANAFSPACGSETPEMYVGDWNGRGVLANPEGYRADRTFNYKLPPSVADGRVVLAGKWRTGHNAMTYEGKKKSAGGELEMRYHARELYAVMNVARAHPSRLYITQDGKDLTQSNKGVDVQIDAQGHSYIEVRASRMYYLVANHADGSHVVVLRP